MHDKKNVRYQVRIIGIISIAIVFLAFFWLYQYRSILDIQKAMIQSWAQHQYQMVEELVDHTLSSQPKSNFDGFLLESVVPKLNYTDASYGFIYKDGMVLFEQDSAITGQYFGKTIRDTYGAFSYRGGEHLLEILEKFESKTSGMDFFVKNHSKGKEYVTWIVFDHAGSTYLVGIATPELSILNEYQFFGIRNDAYAFSSAYTILLILFASLLCLSLYRYKEKVNGLTSEMIAKNTFIQKEKNVVSELEARLKQFVIKDALTGVYNRKFFDVLLQKLVDTIFLPVSICLFSIRDPLESGEKDALLRILVQTCQVLFDENAVVVRYSDHEIAVLLIKTPYELALEKVKQVASASENELQYLSSGKIAYGVATNDSEDGSLKQVLREAEENLHTNMRCEVGALH